MKKKKVKIDYYYPIAVRTVPNGYVLNANGEEHLYFTAPDLITGMMYHITSGIDGDEYMDRLKELVTDLDALRRKMDARRKYEVGLIQQKLDKREKKIAKLEEMLRNNKK